MLEGLEKDDVVIVKSLDRLSRSTMDLLEIAKEIEDKGATLKVLDKDIDTGTAIGKYNWSCCRIRKRKYQSES